jgi:hypothetical protein
MIPRICLECGKKAVCLRNQMFYHILKIPTIKMIEIVTKYQLVAFPNSLQRYTLANLICDYTVENVADKIMNGDSNE